MILTLNCGSSSIKYMLYDRAAADVRAKGIVERIGTADAAQTHEVSHQPETRQRRECADHGATLGLIMRTLTDPTRGVIGDVSEIAAVGHRVVHGGEQFTKSVIIDDAAVRTFESLSDLAPLHNPPNLLGIRAARRMMPDIPHVAVMDTAWHQTLQPPQYIYAVPYEWYQQYGVRRYGFHGTSLLYVAKRAAVLLGKDPFQCNLITLHVGNGVSANAVRQGVSYDTSMGLTPLEGLVMGTRPGDHDASLDFYLMRKEGQTPEELEAILNKQSGLLGISGKSADRRDINQAAARGDARAALAVQIEAYRITKYIGAYSAALGGADAIVWTAGAGEMADGLRASAMRGLESMGIECDPARNAAATSRNAEFEISAPGSKVKVFVIPTDEEMVLTEDVMALIDGRYDAHTNMDYSFGQPDYRNRIRDAQFAAELAVRPEMVAALAQPFPDTLLPDAARPYAWWL
jgi:acetate kinase